MSKSRLRNLLAIGIIALTAAVFAYYIHAHPGTIKQIFKLNPGLLAELLVLYLGTIVALGLIFIATLRCIGIRIESRESLLITMYSAIVNFFGPLQSGPAFRAVYLKQKYAVKLRDYSLATLVYYGWYAAISVVFLLSGVAGRWILGVILAGVVATLVVYRSSLPVMVRLRRLPLPSMGYLGLATALQLGLVAVIYFLELHSIVPNVSISQAVVYTGAANLALFVSITPGAIGFRESFLVFSQRLHHIDSNTIIAANIIDRSVYILLLGILAVFIFGTHAQKRLQASARRPK